MIEKKQLILKRVGYRFAFLTHVDYYRVVPGLTRRQ